MPQPFTAAELATLRADTAGCSSDAIFFNNAGASLQPKPVIARVLEHLRLEERVGGYEAADQISEEHAGVYQSIARLIGAQSDEIAITESATRAWDMAFYSLPFKPGDRILTAQNEYSSNYIALLQMAKRTGAEIVCVPATATGEIDLGELEHALQQGRVKLVALTHIATNNGMVQPACAVGKLTRKHGVLYLLDACQSIGQMPLDVKELACDFLSATGRKFLRAPRGTGFLFVRKELLETLEPPFLDNHAADWSSLDGYTMRQDARRFEAWESSLALALGLGAAADYALELGLDRIAARVQMLAEKLRGGLRLIEGINVTDTGSERSAIVIFVHEKFPAAELVQQLAEKNITVRISPRFGTRLDHKLSSFGELVRASVHYFNTEDDVDRFCGVLATLVRTV